MYLKMLEEEMRTSDQFTKENFGLQIGDGYPDWTDHVFSFWKRIGSFHGERYG